MHVYSPFDDLLEEPTILSQTSCCQAGSRIFLVPENGESAFGLASIHESGFTATQKGLARRTTRR
jgi:hypothetical protein